MNFIDHANYWLTTFSKKGQSPYKLSSEERNRIDQYCKLYTAQKLTSPVKVNSVSRMRKASYSYDWYRIFETTDERLCHFAFGDVQYVPNEPTFTKSRPITENNHNNVLLPLNTIRHFSFVHDSLSFYQKANKAVWRGAAYKDHRKKFLEQTRSMENFDCKDTSRFTPKDFLGKSKNHLPIKHQLNYRYIFAIEGNDVASNLKWVMASNSVAVMPKPRFETWFLESQLIAGEHFIEISPDFDDIEEKLEPYFVNPKLALEINREAKNYASQFFQLDRQFEIAKHVAENYFSLITK